MKNKNYLASALLFSMASLVFLMDINIVNASGTFENPLVGVDNLNGLLSNILLAARNVVVVLAIIAIVIGGMMYIFAGVNEKMVSAGKSAITSALIGLAVVVGAPAFLKEIVDVLGGGATLLGITTTAEYDAALSFQEIALNILNLLLSIVGILGMIGLVLGGSFYLTAAADPKQAEKGKSIAVYSLIGISIALAAMLLVKQVGSLISGS